MQKNEAGDDIYCKHEITHSMDVARVAYIINIEKKLNFPKEIIYAAALLHDIGKWKQRLTGEPHNEAAIKPAKKVLQGCGFSDSEITVICKAILNHRKGPDDGDKFAHLIFRADKLSRTCYACESEKNCNWGFDKKNKALEV